MAIEILVIEATKLSESVKSFTNKSITLDLLTSDLKFTHRKSGGLTLMNQSEPKKFQGRADHDGFVNF